MEKKSSICKWLFIFLITCLFWTNCFAKAMLLPLDFKVRPHYPISAFPAIPVPLNYVLVNNTNQTLPLKITLDSPNLLRIAPTGNTCGNKIKAHATCNLPVVFLLVPPTTLAKGGAKLAPRITFPGRLTIEYGGRFPLVDDTIAIPLNTFGTLTFTKDTTSTNTHLQYTLINVKNNSSSGTAIIGLNITNPSPLPQAPVGPCIPGLSPPTLGCSFPKFASTCPIFPTIIQPGQSCKLWFKSADSPVIPVGFALTGNITISTPSNSGTFTYTYRQGLYATGDFSDHNNVARWNGATWNPLGTGFTGAGDQGNAIAIFQGDLYVGGKLSEAGAGNAIKNLAFWNGVTWSGNGVEIENLVLPASAAVNSLYVSMNRLFVGGLFDRAGGNNASALATWNGTTWNNFGLATPFTVTHSFTSGPTGTVTAGGDVGAIGVSNVAQLNTGATQWIPLADDINGPQNGPVLALTRNAGTNNIFAGGSFNQPAARPFFAQWLNTWLAVDGGLPGALPKQVNALDIFPNISPLPPALQGLVFAGGSFIAGPFQNILGWNGAALFPLATGVDNNVNAVKTGALSLTAAGIFAGGRFTNASGTSANHVAVFNFTGVPPTFGTWSALSTGLGGAGEFVNSLFIGSSLTLTP